MRVVEIDPLTESFDTGAVFEEKSAISQRMKLDPREAFGRTAKIFAPAGFGLLLVWFGLTSTGSYFISATKFGGFLAGLFYGWQFGNLLAMVGIVLIYDSIKRSGYL